MTAVARWKALCLDNTGAAGLGRSWADAAGLELRPAEESGVAWTVLADPEGNEFCVSSR